jgi:hypothetical protein
VTFSRHTNALAVAYQLTPDGESAEIMRRIMNDTSLPPVQPYFMHFVFDALQQAGLFEDYGLREIRRWKALLEEHPSSLKECWDNGDYSHAWGATPAYQLIARVLGVTPASPGFERVNLRPCLGDLERAEGHIPTPYGVIACRLERKDGKVQAKYKLPAQVSANRLPSKETSIVLLD